MLAMKNKSFSQRYFIYNVLKVEQEKEDKNREREMDTDYLAPFLTCISGGGDLTRLQAIRVKDECLQDLKQRLIDKANIIQRRFEQVR